MTHFADGAVIRLDAHRFQLAVRAEAAAAAFDSPASREQWLATMLDMIRVAAYIHQIPVALDMIRKIESMGRVGKKRKTLKC